MNQKPVFVSIGPHDTNGTLYFAMNGLINLHHCLIHRLHFYVYMVKNKPELLLQILFTPVHYYNCQYSTNGLNTDII